MLNERITDRSSIEDPVDREIAQLMDATAIGEAYGPRVSKAYLRALDGGYSANEALDREITRAEEEESFLLLTLMTM